MPASHRRRTTILLIGAMTLAGLLRVVGIEYGLPAVYNPDEVAIMNRAIGLTQTGLNPHNFLYPTLYFYVLLVWEGLWFVLGRVAGVFESLAAFEASFFVDPSSIYLAGRLLTAVLGTATVWATYRLGRVLFGPLAGLSAACVLAVAPLAVRDAHYVKHDVPVTFLVVLTYVLLAESFVSGQTRRRTIAGGLVAGLAMSTHYYAVFLALPVALVALHPSDQAEPLGVRLRRLIWAGGACALAFLAASPFLLVEPLTAVRDVVANRAIVVDRATDATGLFGSLRFYLDWLTRDAMGVSAIGLAGVGLIAAAVADWRRVALLLVFPAVFLAFVANTFPASRYLNPVLPFAAICAGAAIAWLERQRPLGPTLAAVALIVAAAEATGASVRVDRFFRQTDTRTQALDWMAEHVPDGAGVLVQPYSVPLRQSRAGLAEALTRHVGDPTRASVRFRRQLALDPYPSPAFRTIYLGDGGLDQDKIYISPRAFAESASLAPARSMNVTWVVLKQYNQPDPAMSALGEALERGGRLAASFSPYVESLDAADRGRIAPFLHNTDARIRPELERPGPIVEIWTLE